LLTVQATSVEPAGDKLCKHGGVPAIPRIFSALGIGSSEAARIASASVTALGPVTKYIAGLFTRGPRPGPPSTLSRLVHEQVMAAGLATAGAAPGQ